MSHVKIMWVFALAFSTLFGWAMSPQTARADDPALRAEANKLFNDGNFREAFSFPRELAKPRPRQKLQPN